MKSRLPSRWSLVVPLVLLFNYIAPLVPVRAQDCSPLIYIDSPSANSTVQGQTTVAGWAADQDAAAGSGISGVQIVLDNTLDQGGTLLGNASQVARSDVDAALGMPSYGFSASVNLSNVSEGQHTLYVYANTGCGPAYTTDSVNVQPAFFSIDKPAAGTTVANGQQVDIGGWVAGTHVDVYLDGPVGQGQVIGSAQVNKARPDVATATGRSDLANSGFDVIWNVTGLSPGNHTLYVYSSINGQTVYRTDTIVGGAASASSFTSTSTTGSTSPSSSASSGNGVVKIQAPGSGSLVSSQQVISGYAADCGTGQPARTVRLYSGGANGTLLGQATLGASSTPISQVCPGANSAVSAAGWTYTLNASGLTPGSVTITAVADVTGGTAQDSVALSLSPSAVNGGTNTNGNYTSGYTGSGATSTFTPANNGACNPYYSGYNSGYQGNTGYPYSTGYNSACNGYANPNCSPYYNGANTAYPYNSGYNTGYNTACNGYANTTCGSYYSGVNSTYPYNTGSNPACGYGNTACSPYYTGATTGYPYNSYPYNTSCNGYNSYGSACSPYYTGATTGYPYNSYPYNGCGTTSAYSGTCNPYYPTYNASYPSNTPCSGTTAGYGYGTCNPYYPTYNASYPSNTPCSGTTAGYGNCNPYYPTYNVSYPNNVPCSGTTAGYGYGNCNPYYPTYNVSYPNNVPCSGTTAGYGNCNPYYPTYNVSYPNNIPCTGTGLGTGIGPASVTATASGAGQVVVSWAPVAGATYYIVWEQTPANVQLTQSATNQATVFVAPGQNYTFGVQAFVSGTPSAITPSNPVFVS